MHTCWDPFLHVRSWEDFCQFPWIAFLDFHRFFQCFLIVQGVFWYSSAYSYLNIAKQHVDTSNAVYIRLIFCVRKRGFFDDRFQWLDKLRLRLLVKANTPLVPSRLVGLFVCLPISHARFQFSAFWMRLLWISIPVQEKKRCVWCHGRLLLASWLLLSW